MPFITRGTWIVVADRERALILENAGDAHQPDLRAFDHLEAPALPIPTDRPGRRPDVGPGQRSAMEVPDQARLAMDRMAGDLVRRLGHHAGQGLYSRLVIAAPPQVLSAIRLRMDAGLRARVALELPRRLTGLPLGRILSLVSVRLGSRARPEVL